MHKIKVAIIGSGNIGSDLMIKIIERSTVLEMGVLVGIDADSDGLKRAAQLGIATTCDGIAGLQAMDIWGDIKMVFDATSAAAHRHHHDICTQAGKVIIDLTPAAIGPFTVPTVNIDAHMDKMNVNMVSCGGQATIPMVAAVGKVAKVHYGEIVASMASLSAGPGTRANIDEFTATTARAIETVGGATKGKAIIVLNPADPPILMRNTIFILSDPADETAVISSVADMERAVQRHVVGYRLKQRVQFEHYDKHRPLYIADLGTFVGTKTSIFVEVEGAGDYLPTYAGNLDIMTSSALGTAERLCHLKFNSESGA